MRLEAIALFAKLTLKIFNCVKVKTCQDHALGTDRVCTLWNELCFGLQEKQFLWHVEKPSFSMFNP